MGNIKVSFPQIASYDVPISYMFEQGLDVDYVTPPPITKRTLEIGSKYSPDFVCAPFKYCLGNFIETIEKGANTLVQTGGVCRLGYYGELHEQILRDLGYDIKFVNLANARYSRPLSFYNDFKEINPNMNLKHIAKALPVAMAMVEHIDKMEDFIRQNVGFETVEGSFAEVYDMFLHEMKMAESKKELDKIYAKYRARIKKIPVHIPKNPLRVGIVGEYYTIMEPFSNHFMEKELAKMGIVVYRYMNISSTILHANPKEARQHIKKYANYDMGATSMYTIDRALEFAKKGFDGIIHVKSFGCTPEMDAMPVLQNIAADYKIPILYFSFDSQTSETGIQTRLEAFYDMIMARKDNKK